MRTICPYVIKPTSSFQRQNIETDLINHQCNLLNGTEASGGAVACPITELRFVRAGCASSPAEPCREFDNIPRLSIHSYTTTTPHHVCRFLTPVPSSSAMHTCSSLVLDHSITSPVPNSVNTLHRILPIANMRMRLRTS